MKQSKNKFQPQNCRQAPQAIHPWTALRRKRSLVLVLLFCVLGFGGLLLSVVSRDNKVAVSKQSSSLHKKALATPVAFSLADLLELPKAELEHTDVALMNLLCAQRLLGADELNVSNVLATLDQWTRRVQTETDRHLYRFRANPLEFHSSEAYFRMLMMAVVFYEDFKIRYNPDRMSNPENMNPVDHFFDDSRDIFLHGLIGDRRMGTCSSMPVLYAAVGRRLGYPLKLVTTKAHLFLRWEDEKERFDLEATGRGMTRYDDEHFKRWPFPVSEEEIRTEGYLKSLTAVEELAVFLSLRANCLKEAGQVQQAAACYAQAARLAPGSRSYGLLLADLQQPSQPVQSPSRQGAAPSASRMVGHDPNPLQVLRPQ